MVKNSCILALGCRAPDREVPETFEQVTIADAKPYAEIESTKEMQPHRYQSYGARTTANDLKAS